MSTSRSSGVLMHISSLWGQDSIGSFGRAAYQFVDFLAAGGFTWWQVLPFCMADECNSPYKSYSAFGGNPYFVDLGLLVDAGYLTTDERDTQRQETPYVCEYDKLAKTRLPILRLAASRATEADRATIAAFMEEHPYLEQFCVFMAYRAVNLGRPWYEWEISEEEAQEQAMFEIEHFAWQFIQYHFMKQWQDVRSYANSKGVRIMGDIPIYVSYDSCDVWANREQFLLDEDGRPAVVAGCPPDAFTEDGQLWGNPIYDWAHMQKDGYAWWSDRMRHMLTLFDGVRIDHFRGLESYWSIPADAETAREGHWERGPREPFVEQIRRVVDEFEAAHGQRPLIIAEDLGTDTPDLRTFVEGSGFPGMRILQFGFDGDPANMHAPHNYTRQLVAYTGTHDNNTLLGVMWEQDEAIRRNMLAYCGYTDPNWDSPAAYDAVIRTLFASVADLVVLPIQDVLGFGADTRMNTPGVARGNWEYRVTGEQLASIDREKYRRLNALYGRG